MRISDDTFAEKPLNNDFNDTHHPCLKDTQALLIVFSTSRVEIFMTPSLALDSFLALRYHKVRGNNAKLCESGITSLRYIAPTHSVTIFNVFNYVISPLPSPPSKINFRIINNSNQLIPLRLLLNVACSVTPAGNYVPS